MRKKAFFQTLEKRFRKFPNLGTFLLAYWFATTLPVSAQSDADKVSNAVNAVRLELEATLGKPVPSLSLILQTSNRFFFTSSSAAPERILATNTTFRFASNTKNFTATAILHMHQQGWLNITNRIVDNIPGSGQPYIPATSNWNIPYKSRITIEQLLRHSAGVYDVDNDVVPGCGEDGYTAYILSIDPAHQFTQEELVGQAALHQLSYFAPDEGYHYSNTGYSLLAEIVARVYSFRSGMTKNLTDYLYEHITGGSSPVSLDDLHFPNLASDTDLPVPYISGMEYYPSNVVEVFSNVNICAQVGEGNGYGSMYSLNRHIRALMKGEHVLASDTVRLMQRRTSPHNADYALGCTFTKDLGYGHNGARAGYLSLMCFNPDTDISVAVCLPLRDYSDGMASFMHCY